MTLPGKGRVRQLLVLLLLGAVWNSRFDAGSGMATIRHPSIIKLGEFHTVRLFRNLTQGSLVLDHHPPVNGTSQVSVEGGESSSSCIACTQLSREGLFGTGAFQGWVYLQATLGAPLCGVLLLPRGPAAIAFQQPPVTTYPLPRQRFSNQGCCLILGILGPEVPAARLSSLLKSKRTP